eukprot:TRINITY_DN22465_c0_g1_i1.p1 TRINITY_DN22465_c0_g1~~TRINITY_DN22465_c0_g1_i1.p1  ORF type:complete len:255 (-),score=29.12 TRINITY_DN22465_c0_g1_i1:69-833(-)
MELVQPDQWQDKTGVKSCPFCAKEFGPLKWKRNCHACGRILCDNCSATAAMPPQYQEAVRVCRDCKPRVAAVFGSSGKDVKQSVGGRTLGGAAQTDESDRELRARMAEERMQALQSRGMGKLVRAATANLAPVSPATERSNPASPPGGIASTEQSSLNRTPSTPMEDTDREMRASAAEARMKGYAGLGEPKAQELDIRRQKAEIIGQIKEQLVRLGGDEPFGLHGMALPKLKQYLADLRQRRVIPKAVVKMGTN